MRIRFARTARPGVLRRVRGLTLVEAMICVVILGLTATGISTLYVSGLRSLDGSDERLMMDSLLRSAMEGLVSRSFADLAATVSGTTTVNIQSVDHTATWTAARHDLDGDGILERNVLRLELTLEGRSLTAILVDHEDPIARIP